VELEEQSPAEVLIPESLVSVEANEASTIIYQGIDYDRYSLLELAVMAEFEITGQSVTEIQDSLRLQMIVIKSQLIKSELANLDKLNRLLDYVYEKQAFSGDWKAFFKVENVLISKVLSRRKGVPISLGILLIEMLKQAGLDACGICFPSGFIVTVNLGEETVYIDPFNGEIVNFAKLELKVRGQLGNHARLTPDMLEVDTHETIIKRYVNVLKASYIQADNIELALLCSDILLRLDPEDAYEVRDRGFLFQQLDCFQLACNDFKYFIEQCPKDPIVSLLQQQIRQMSEEQNAQTIH
jgi:regulator of sirC expression with transglutaminase-like and TPR domain